MKRAGLAAGAAVFGVLFAGIACAQGPYSDPYNAAGAGQGSMSSGMGARPVAYMADEPAAGGDESGEDSDEPKPWKLFHGSWLADHNININGWIDAGITANPENPSSHFNGPLAPNDLNEFQFNQVYLIMEKTVDTEKHDWDVGGRLDLMYGTDWVCFAAPGVELTRSGLPNWNGYNYYGLGMPQFYGEVAHGKLDFKVGRFYTIIGYESMMPTNNFFYSMNYAVRYGEPTTHTGGLFTWKQSDDLSLYLGGVNGGDRVDAEVNTFAVLTGFAYTPKEKKWALNFGLQTAGTEPGIQPVQGGRTYFSTVFTYNFNDKWQAVTQIDAGWQQNYNLAGGTADFWSVTDYLFYKINDKWKAGLRYDMFVDDQGTRIGGLRFGGLENPLPMPAGAVGTVQAITAGLNWTPHTNVRIRPELRWDWFDGTSPTPLFDDNTKDHQFTAAVDAILLF